MKINQIINIMKKTFYSLFISFIIFSCSTSKELREDRKSWDYKNWDNQFKKRAISLCILKGYENKKIENLINENDYSFYSPLGKAIFDKALEPIINKEITKIKFDSIKLDNTYPNDLKSIYQKRNVFGHCLDFYESKQLDSITRVEKKKWKKLIIYYLKFIKLFLLFK